MSWKEATEAAFGREIDSIYFPAHKGDLCALCASVVKGQEAMALGWRWLQWRTQRRRLESFRMDVPNDTTAHVANGDFCRADLINVQNEDPTDQECIYSADVKWCG